VSSRLGYVRTCQVMYGEDEVTSGHVRSCKVKTRSGQVIAHKVWSGNVRSVPTKVRTDQDMS